MYLDVCMVEHDDASRKAESTTFAEPAHRLGTAVDDSFFLVCKRADSIASYNNRVVMRDNTFVIAISLICMPDNTVANYHNGVVMPDNRGHPGLRSPHIRCKAIKAFVGARTYDNDSFSSHQHATAFDKKLSIKLAKARTYDIHSFLHHIDAHTFDPKLS